jgi:hypothetical protein
MDLFLFGDRWPLFPVRDKRFHQRTPFGVNACGGNEGIDHSLHGVLWESARRCGFAVPARNQPAWIRSN